MGYRLSAIRKKVFIVIELDIFKKIKLKKSVMDQFDKEGKEIVESYQRDEWISSDDNLKETITKAAKKNHLKNEQNNICDRK
jgi:uncharacterized protein YjhX (UPF0386 family)